MLQQPVLAVDEIVGAVTSSAARTSRSSHESHGQKQQSACLFALS
jgi:hypothetical protein